MGDAGASGWVCIALTCPREEAGAVEEALDASGAAAISLEDAGEEPRFESWPPDRPLWGVVRVTGLFPAEADGLEKMAGRVSPEVLGTVLLRELPETDWVRAGRDRVRPMRFGDRLWVCPTWVEPPPEAASGTVVRLDPGLAFGTGSHPTTRLCLRHLARLDLAGKLVIDYGCGSGILGIAALGLGARRCLAVDIDPQALEVARGTLAATGWPRVSISCLRQWSPTRFVVRKPRHRTCLLRIFWPLLSLRSRARSRTSWGTAVS